jgi:hypothetical protein
MFRKDTKLLLQKELLRPRDIRTHEPPLSMHTVSEVIYLAIYELELVTNYSFQEKGCAWGKVNLLYWVKFFI